MANLTYRQATQEAPVSTTTKNATLTSQEIDGNFKSLNDEPITKAPLVSPSLSGVPTAPTAVVEAIQVTTTAGNTFDGDEESQGRMARAILGLESVPNATVTWVLADNSEIQVTTAELREALALAGAEQARLWVKA